VLLFLPIVLVAGGALGGLIGGVGIVVNATILRASVNTLVKTALMIAVLGAAVVVWLVLAAALQSASS
jgi:hypothetical protein